MAYGLLLLLINAVVLTCFAIVQQQVARRQLALIPFYAVYSLLGCLLSLPAFWLGGGGPLVVSGHFLLLAGITALSSLLTAVAVICCVAAMRDGHTGVVLAIVQSAMAVSFLAAIVFWGEPFSPLRVAGLALVVLMIVLLAPRERPAQAPQGLGWFALALLAFATNGIGQVLYVAPSHLPPAPGFTLLQVPVFMGAAFLALLPALVRQRAAVSRPLSGLALALALLGIINLALILVCVALLKPLALSGIVYPVSTAGGLVLFSLYSRLVLREEYTLQKWGGLAIGIGGLVLFCLR